MNCHIKVSDTCHNVIVAVV